MISNCIVTNADRDQKEWVDRETVNMEMGVGRGKWVNKHTRGRGWFSFPVNE